MRAIADNSHPMSTTQQHPYEPTQRLIDNRRRLAKLYIEQDLTIREIADNHADVTRSPVHEALQEYGLIEQKEEQHNNHSHGGYDPPSETTNESVDWTKVSS